MSHDSDHDQLHDRRRSRTQAPGETRRHFLGKTVALAAASAALSSCATSSSNDTVSRLGAVPTGPAPTPVRAGEPVRIGVIGTGGMGTEHCRSFIRLSKDGRFDARVVAMADVNKIRLDRAHAECTNAQPGTIDTYRNYHDLLKRDDIHGVLIAAPEHWHAKMAIDALASGKDVYCEKPMTLRLDEALHLRKVVHANPHLVFQVGTQMMMLPKYVEARKVIAESGLGKPVFSQTSYCRNSKEGEWLYYDIEPEVVPGPNLDWNAWLGHLGPRPFDGAVYAQWRRYKDFSTGIIGDLLVHQITPLLFALGDSAGWPTRVVASGGHYIDKAMENHDQVNLNIEFEGEHTMIVAGSTCNDIGLETMVRGHEATMWLNGRNPVIRPQRHWVDEIDEREIPCEDIGNDQDALRANWAECIRTREPAMSNVELATKVMVMVDLATRSMWEGCAFEFDPDSMKARRCC